jgi:hypothetical protein
MTEIIDFIEKNATRGACMCGKCADAPSDPENHQPVSDHTADVQFFKVALRDQTVDKKQLRDRLREILSNHVGTFNKVNLLDGEEHNFMEIGGYVGDQGLALTLMGLGELIGMWELLTPNKLFSSFPDDLKIQMAGQGFVTIRYVESQ